MKSRGHTLDKNLQIIALLDALIELAQVAKILDSFYVSFEEKTIDKQDGRHWLFGSLKLGGTISGRLSSNLQQLPSTGTKYAKPVKQCFQAPDDWLLVGIDYSSLEDRISALLTKDPNKLKVYTDGYDGHALRALSYFGDQMPDILEALAKAETATEFWIDDNGNPQCK